MSFDLAGTIRIIILGGLLTKKDVDGSNTLIAGRNVITGFLKRKFIWR
jgi:hypothetical protein